MIYGIRDTKFKEGSDGSAQIFCAGRAIVTFIVGDR